MTTSLDVLEAEESFSVLTTAESGAAAPMEGTVFAETHEVNRLFTLIAVILPLAGLIGGAALMWGWGFGWLYLALWIGGYIVTGLGITVGYHRLFTHKAFDTGPVMTTVLGILGSMAVEGPIIMWAHNHRRHHQYSDKPGDVHSPHLHDEGLKGWLQGAWHSHVGWLFDRPEPDGKEYVRDLVKQPLVRMLSKTFVLWVFVGLFLPAGIAFAIEQTWQSALLGFLWGGLARIFLVHHITWSVNSVCHIWGRREFRTQDHSRNNTIFGVLALGEGWHNNHHAFPTSARHGLRWWQFDLSWVVIRTMMFLGLATNVRLPDSERMAAKAI